MRWANETEIVVKTTYLNKKHSNKQKIKKKRKKGLPM